MSASKRFTLENFNLLLAACKQAVDTLADDDMGYATCANIFDAIDALDFAIVKAEGVTPTKIQQAKELEVVS
jgi:hypothetical protein